MIFSEALCFRVLSICTLALTASIPPSSLFVISSIAANSTIANNTATAYNLPLDPYVYRNAVPFIITFYNYGAPLWAYSVEQVILNAMLDVGEHDDQGAINETTLHYEDIYSPTERAALEICPRNRMTWHGWSLVVDALQKVFKGDYVELSFGVAMTVTPTQLRYLGLGRLYKPKDA